MSEPGEDRTEERLQAVIRYADDAHGSQMRRYTGDRYIVHPIRVMNTCRHYTQDISVLAAAILHDVLEDTPVKPDKLRNFLCGIMTPAETEKTFKLVVELTDVYVKEAFPKLNRKRRKEKEADRLEASSEDAQTIKYADILDNSPEITDQDPDFAERYLRECRALLKRLKKGNPELRSRALETINTCLNQLP